jgi:thiosulfate/3-mercaptopyruvate sulfurtransferase
MRPPRSILVAVIAALLLPAWNVHAGNQGTRLLVTTSWLAAHLTDPDLVLLHVGDKPGYEAQHIAGARHVAVADISISDHAEKGLRLEMPAADDLQQRLEKLGISETSRIVVYYGKDWVSPATRVLFTLDYAGLGARTSLLDGGMQTWIAEGRAVTTEVLPAKSGKLSPLKLRETIVNAEAVLARVGTPGVAVIDSRDEEYYSGTSTGGPKDRPHRTGHIAGARSIPFSELTNEDLIIRSPEELRAIFTKAGVKPGDTLIIYCHIGQQATAIIFAARLLGQNALLYDGSFEDWSRHHGYPVEKAGS